MLSIEQVETIFHQALLLPGDVDRNAWLAKRCGANTDLIAEIASLLAAHEAMALTPDPTGNHSAQPSLVVPSEQFGAYRLVRLLGRGGMSAVYLGERVDGQFDKQVAVKVMAAHLAGEEFLKRWHTEVQVLASLQDPNIPVLLDSGISPSGHPYLVVDYVEGEALDTYCDRYQLGIEPRLRVFLQVCQAVEHAHRALILHRDLKPSNILVTAARQVKLLDFGTAALMAEDANVTATRARMLTPQYASPEQLRGERPGVTGDVFSLGVILYELLTGAWPFGDPTSPLSELRRATGHASASAPSSVVVQEAAGVRSLTVDRLKQAVSGDLAAILLKALENDQARRYATVAELSDDVRRFLDGHPVQAHPQTLFYRAGKLVRRRWALVIAAAVFVLGLSTATVIALHQAQVANEEARRAESEARKSDRVTRFLRGMLTTGFRTGGTAVTVLQMLNASEPAIEKSWKGDPLAEATLRESLGASYLTLVQPDRAERQLKRALALFQSQGRHSDAADTLLVLGILEQGPRGRIHMAADYYRAGLDELQKAGKDAPPALVFRLKVYLAGVLMSAFRLDQSRAMLDDAMALAARDSTVPTDLLIAAWVHQGELLLEQGRFDPGEALFRKAIAADRSKTDAWAGLARSSWLKQNYTAAADLARQDYEIEREYNREHLADAAEAEATWALYRAEAGDAGPAVDQINAAMPELRRNYLTGFMLAVYLQTAARVSNDAGRSREAAQYARESLDACRQAQLPEVHPLVAAATEDLGTALAGLKQYREAITALEKASEVDRRLGTIYLPTADRIQSALQRIPGRR